MKIAVCVKQVPDATPCAADRSADEPARPIGRGCAQRHRRERRRGGAPDQGGPGRRGRRRLVRARQGRRLAAQGARDGRRPRAARLGRRRRRLRPRRHELRAREGARAGERRTSILFGQQSRDSDGAVLWAAVADRLRRPVDLPGRGARRRGLVADRQAPDGVRLRRHRGAPAGRGRGLRRHQRAALSVAQGDHGREVEADRDADARGDRRRGGARGRRGLADDGDSRWRRLPRRGIRSRSRTTARPPSGWPTGSRRRSCCDDTRLPRAPRRRHPEGRARRAREGGLHSEETSRASSSAAVSPTSRPRPEPTARPPSTSSTGPRSRLRCRSLGSMRSRRSSRPRMPRTSSSPPRCSQRTSRRGSRHGSMRA